jgi:hypothetical protein
MSNSELEGLTVWWTTVASPHGRVPRHHTSGALAWAMGLISGDPRGHFGLDVA